MTEHRGTHRTGPPVAAPGPVADPVIEVARLHKRYRDQVAVRDVSFTVARGEIFGILGANGAGKTTTVECIEGLRSPDGGRVRVLGLDPRADRARLRRRVGVQLQEGQLPERITAIEALRLYASFYDDPADPDRLLAQWGLAARHRTVFKKLSGGQKQRLFIALALVGNPEIVVLDELTTGLDPQARQDTWDVVEEIRAGGVTVVLVTHFMDEAERLCDRVVVLDAGRVVALDSPASLVAASNAEQRLSFRPSVPLDDAVLTALPEVRGVLHRGAQVVVTGRGDVVAAVTGALARRQVVAEQLRVEQVGLDQAFRALLAEHGERPRPANVTAPPPVVPDRKEAGL